MPSTPLYLPSLLDEILPPSKVKPILTSLGAGRPDAPILIVGEAWGEEEERTGVPFSGRSGYELNSLLNEAGIMRSDCYVTNVVNARPPRNDLDSWIPEKKTAITSDMVEFQGKWMKPVVKAGIDSLLKEIDLIKPRLIITLGNTAMWVLTERTGIVKWRGSLLEFRGIRVLPTYHPAAVLRMAEWRPLALLDLKRAAVEFKSPTALPPWRFRLAPSFSEVLYVLNLLRNRARCFDEEVWIDFDIETVRGHIRCFALSWSREDSLCIPLIAEGYPNGYWGLDQEACIIWHVYKLFTAPNVKIRGQNLLYDFQYVHRHWHFIPNLGQDTMISHHVLWAGLPKSLLFQASMYCKYFSNWKDMVRHNEEKEGA